MGSSIMLGTSLIDMYAKFGCLDITEKVSDEMPKRNLICWNAMISGFAVNGNACSNAGMANEGLNLLNLMSNVYHIEPKGEHYGCIIDVLSRAGLLDEERKIVQNMPNSSVPSEEAIS
ncbi:hypothetical protein RDI58_013412 [Solanum bulbocastanum]|uniref:Pentatricopeptide repeat-containing protein n=1 Tax=Solanum bulbocastanum TaxID=147425 RepID=A0AAN8YEM0_SOLBU